MPWRTHLILIKTLCKDTVDLLIMLRIKNSELRLTTQGYHFDNHGGKKFVRVFTSLNFIKIQVKIQRNRTMHILAVNKRFPYNLTDDWVEITIPYCEIPGQGGPWLCVENCIDNWCNKIWFV